MVKNKTTVVSTGGISFFSLFFLVLFVLKVTGNITWSWWWITAPLWGGIAIFSSVFVIGLLFVMLLSIIDKYNNNRRRKKINSLNNGKEKN